MDPAEQLNEREAFRASQQAQREMLANVKVLVLGGYYHFRQGDGTPYCGLSDTIPLEHYVLEPWTDAKAAHSRCVRCSEATSIINNGWRAGASPAIQGRMID